MLHPAPPRSATLRLLRWLEAMVLILGVALAMLGCQSGAATGATVGRGAGAWWSTISGDGADTARGQAMGEMLGHQIGAVLGVDADRQVRQSRLSGYAW